MTTADFASLATAPIRALRAYDPGHDIVALRRQHAPQPLIELGSNENAYGASPAAAAAVTGVLSELYRYPDPLGGELKRGLATLHGVDPRQIVLGNGSHELLMQAAQVFTGPSDEVLMSQYGFAVYAIAAAAAGARAVQVAALPETAAMPFGHDLAAMARAIGPDTRLIYLCNPNNPTGTWLERTALGAFAAALPAHAVLVVDEAYAEYVDADDYASALPLLAEQPRMLVMRTFSKAYGLAGMRVGYAVGHPQLVSLLERVRESFNVSLPSLAAAQAALDDQAHLASVRQRNAAERAWLAKALRERGLACADSQTNFLLCHVGDQSLAIQAALLRQRVVLRPMAGYGLPEYVRITVGRRDENRGLLAALDRTLNGATPC